MKERKEGDSLQQSFNEMTDKLYIYAVARIRSKELLLFTKSDIEQLMSCKTEKECLGFLADKGWGKDGVETSEELLAAEREKTWDLLKELVQDISVFNTFLYEMTIII